MADTDSKTAQASLDADAENIPREEDQFAVQKPVGRWTRWYRSPLFNVVIVGLISFTQPGIWNALNNTGAGGQQEPYLVNGANSLTFGLMVFGCPLFSILANKFGLKRTLMFGTLGYAPYSAALYVNNRYGTEWFVLFGGATCGIAASALWASEGAIALGYPQVTDRGNIQLSLNVHKNQRGKVGYGTYLVLIGIQCLGLPLSFLISDPEKIIRPDGTKIPDPTKGKSVKKEFGKLFALLKTKRVFLLIPILIGFNWNNTYQSIYLTRYFSVRSRALGALMSGIMATIADVFWGWFLDLKYFSRPALAKITWFSFAIIMFGLFAWQVANEQLYSTAAQKVTLDWDTPGFGRAFAVNTLFRLMNESHYVFVYWILGTFNNDMETLTLTVGIVRSFESVGSCLAFGLGAAKISPMANLIVAFVAFTLAVPATTMVVFLIPENPDDLDPTRLENVSETQSEAEDGKASVALGAVPIAALAAGDVKG